MEEQKGVSLLNLLMVIAVIAFILAMIMPVIQNTRRRARRIVCPTNLKGLGTAMIVYANDYDDKYPQLGKGQWSKGLGYSYEDTAFKAYDYEGPCTITSSLYLLVREADVSPKSFVCPDSDQEEFDGRNTKNLDIVELWDFGPDPCQHVSYAYHNPYGKFPADGNRSAAFAILADMNPWFKNGDIVKPGTKNQPPQLLTISDVIEREQIKNSNAYHHDYEGQSVTWADGHASFEKQPNVGVKNDNIYTYWSTEENPTDQDIQGGTAPASRGPENDAKSKDDSFLVL